MLNVGVVVDAHDADLLAGSPGAGEDAHGRVRTPVECEFERTVRQLPHDPVDPRLSRSEYLRRALTREAAGEVGEVSVDDLRHFSRRFADLADPEVMREAWK